MLARVLGGPRILVKRDDLTGLALGGNKARKLELLLADALAVFKVKTYANDAERQRSVRLLCALVPVAWTILFVIWGSPVTLVFVGAIAQVLVVVTVQLLEPE